MRRDSASVTLLSPVAPDAAPAQLAPIVSLAADGTPTVQIAGGPLAPAMLAVPVTRAQLEAAMERGDRAVVLFEGGDPARPIIVGFVQAPPAASPATAGNPAPVVEADVDGRRVRVTAQDEIVLQCGSASITLRRNGRVIVRGTYIETRSEGTNRIRGGQVQIN